MANEVTFSSISTDAPNVAISQQMYRLAEKNLRLGKYATRYDLPQRMSKTLRVVRFKRMNLPLVGGTLTEGTPPSNTALTVENVDVTVEQWGIVAQLTDVGMITTKHPALQIAVDRSALAMSEVIEREMGIMLLAGTSVVFANAATSRATLALTDIVSTATILKALNTLRTQGAATFDGDLYAGVMPPAVEATLLGSDTTFQTAHNFVNVKALEYGEIGMWMGVRWARSNFLPSYKTVPAPASTATAERATTLTGATGGTFTAGATVNVAVVARDAFTDMERKISLTAAIALGGSNTQFTITMPTSTNYTYDVYVSDTAAGTGTARLSSARNAASAVVTVTGPASGTAAAIAATSSTNQVETFITWVFGKDAFGRVELNGMSLQSYITPAGSSFSNPLAQGRKVGSKIMWKSFILDNTYFCRIESSASAALSGLLPA